METIKHKELKFANFESKTRPGKSFKKGFPLSDMVLGKVKCPEKRDELIKELNKLKSELAQLQVTKVMEIGHQTTF